MQIQVTKSVGPTKLSMGCGYLVMFILLAGGIGLLALAGKQHERFGPRWTKEAVIPGVIGAALVLGAGVYLRVARRLVRENREEEARRAQFPDQPWKWKQEWQAPFIGSEGGSTAAGLWVFAILWNALSFPAAWVVFHDAHHEKAANLVLIFPLVGLGVLWGAIYQTVRWRKFGRTRFVPSTMSGAIGGYLGGVIEVPARVLPEADARLALKCVRRETRGSGKNRHTTDVVLWEHEEQIARDKWITGTGGTRIPVLFYIPPTCGPTDDSDRNNEVLWRLSAHAAVPGVDFAASFKVPVFVTGVTAPPPEPGAPLLEEYTAPAFDAAGLAACGVRREGDTFYFSASHLPGTKLTTAVLSLGFLGLLAWYWGRDIPGVVWAITIFFWLIINLFTVSVWCEKFELRLEAKDVVVTKPRPWGTKVTRMPRAEVALVRAEKSMSSGENQYYKLSLVGTQGVDPGETPAAGEPFAVRKLRYQLEQQKKQGELTAGKLKEIGSEIYAQLKQAEKFCVPFASHIPGQTKAEAIGALVMREIRGKV
jgi:hypothetical protein